MKENADKPMGACVQSYTQTKEKVYDTLTNPPPQFNAPQTSKMGLQAANAIAGEALWNNTPSHTLDETLVAKVQSFA